ncbi:MAG TPA: sigma 54-interacting transcriptional regulator [Polyangiaceae bacterium]|nr:sigma 54-interacting transcriptional regulator [Polyangiaceae bacterium]
MTTTTLSSDGGGPESRHAEHEQHEEDGRPRDLGLVILWSESEPHRVGEVALATGTRDAAFVLGRGSGTSNSAMARLAFFRQRPGDAQPCPPLQSGHISREQLALSPVEGGTALYVKNVGRCRLMRDGAEVRETRVRPGDLLELRGQLLLMCVRRFSWVGRGASSKEYTDFPFGESDAHGWVGESPEAWRMRQIVAFVAKRTGHVLIRGASGTGKELVARALHELSDRGKRALVSRNAATFPEALIDAELFGNARNYPNSGMDARVGIIGEVDGSTLFLDEFAELRESMQSHFLRLLDGGEYTRLGEARPRKSDFRLIAATNREESALKHDILARFPFRIELVGLHERREDVPLLVRQVLRRIRSSDPEALARFTREDGEVRVSASFIATLVRHAYSLHVRELEALTWKAILASTGERISLKQRGSGAGADTKGESLVPERVREEEEGEGVGGGDGALALTAARIQACLDENKGVIERAWRPLGLPSRHALARLIRKHGLEVRRPHGK